MAKELQLKFNEFPFVVPSVKIVSRKLEAIINNLKECGSITTALPVIKKWNKYTEELSTQCSLIYIRYTLDTQNKTYVKAMDRLTELTPILSNCNNQFMKILTKASYRKDLEAKFGKYLLKKYDASLKTFNPVIMADLEAEQKLTTEYDAVLGGAQVDFRGETLNLSQLGKYLQDKDRDTRKLAAQTMDKWLGENEAKIADIYDKLVKLRDSMAKKLGYKNFVELGYLNLGRTDYNAKMVKGYREQIYNEVVPVAQKLLKQQMKDLGIKNPQYYDYNLRFKSGNAKPAGDCKYLVDAADYMFSNLSKESKEYFKFMQNHELLDLEARKGKAPGGYCDTLSYYGAPFIFSNFNGTEGDINVLTHEGGHAFQGYVCKDIKVPEYRNPTLESCEIHSMSMEFFAWPYMDKFCKGDAEKYKYAHLCDAIEFLPYGVTVDEFQHWVYENPEATHEERCAEWKRIETKYTPHKKFDDCPTLNKGTIWMRQAHIFASPFYYIDYTLAQVVAFQFLAEDIKNHDKAWKKYFKFTKCGGKYPFQELLEKNHLRNPFVDGTVRKNVAPLIKVLKGFDTSKF